MSAQQEQYDATVNLESALLRWFQAHDLTVDDAELAFIDDVFFDLDHRLSLGKFRRELSA